MAVSHLLREVVFLMDALNVRGILPLKQLKSSLIDPTTDKKRRNVISIFLAIAKD